LISNTYRLPTSIKIIIKGVALNISNIQLLLLKINHPGIQRMTRYDFILRKFNLISLTNLRLSTNIDFLQKLFFIKIDCLLILLKLNFNIPSQITHLINIFTYFALLYNYELNEPLLFLKFYVYYQYQPFFFFLFVFNLNCILNHI